METKRRKFQGVLNILNFNRHFYFFGITVLIIIIISQLILHWNINLKWILSIFIIYGLIAPLIVSAYVYDYSKYYDMSWLDTFNFKDTTDTKIVNINAGFDETSHIIKYKFPKSNLKVFDFYDEHTHTEKAIKRARKTGNIYANTKVINTDKIPLRDQSVDIIFLLSAAHEIRSNREKSIFLKECNRILKPSGNIIMVEHLRDLPNFLAFSIGFTHFFSRKLWKKVFKVASFKFTDEVKFTPFMSIFNYTK